MGGAGAGCVGYGEDGWEGAGIDDCWIVVRASLLLSWISLYSLVLRNLGSCIYGMHIGVVIVVRGHNDDWIDAS